MTLSLDRTITEAASFSLNWKGGSFVVQSRHTFSRHRSFRNLDNTKISVKNLTRSSNENRPTKNSSFRTTSTISSITFVKTAKSNFVCIRTSLFSVSDKSTSHASTEEIFMEASGVDLSGSGKVGSTLSESKLPGSAKDGSKREIWLQTTDLGTFTCAVERGCTEFVFERGMGEELLSAWKKLARFNAHVIHGGGCVTSENSTCHALIREVGTGEDLEAFCLLAEHHSDSERKEENVDVEKNATEAEILVLDAKDWKIISSENAVASFQGSSKRLFACAATSEEGIILFQSLEKGVDGVLLRTNSPEDVQKLKSYLDARFPPSSSLPLLPLSLAYVTSVRSVGMGERVCVDLCSLMKPGEGMLVGSFARSLFLVHSECLLSDYVASRPFRVNAGPVHSYVAVPGGKTSYLSELTAGSEVLISNSLGEQRTCTVGRVKIETRPLVMVEVKMKGRDALTQTEIVFLQNAETVRFVSPELASTSTSQMHDLPPPSSSTPSLRVSACPLSYSVHTLPVTQLKEGDAIFVFHQEEASARHTGIAVQEYVLEK